jgi:TIR domain-containing protein
LNGVFVSYSRADQPIARRVRSGLYSLNIDVLWDESMPGVDWQEFLEQSIDGILAVVVLWTPHSYRSGSVRDEARLGLDKGKLVNLLYGVDKPRFPFDRINGLAIDDWIAGSPHSGWARLASTLDERLAAAGAIARPGMVTAALGEQLKTVGDRRATLAGLERERARALNDVGGKDRMVTRAEEGVAAALAQLDQLRAISPSKAVMNAAFADRDEAASKVARATSELALARAAADRIAEEIRLADADLRDYLISIGGKSETETEMERGPPRNVEPDPPGQPPVAAGGSREVEPAEGLERPVGQAGPGDGARDRPVAGGSIAANRSDDASATPADPGHKPPPDGARRWWNLVTGGRPALPILAVMAVMIVVAGVWAAVANWPRGGDPPSQKPVAAAPTESPPPGVAQASPARPDSPTRPGWIVGDWVVDAKRLGCQLRVNVSYEDKAAKLVFKGSDGPPDIADYRVRSLAPPIIETDEHRYERLSSGRIKVTERKSGTVAELSKCKS